MAIEMKKVAIIAFGMEHCKRGVETHARMLFERLGAEEDIDVFLIKGSGRATQHEIVLSVPKRETWLNRLLGKVRGYNIYWEQVFFMIRLAFHLARHKYDFIYTQEYVHLVGMGRLKKWIAPQSKLVYCEGFIAPNQVRLKYADIIHDVNRINYDHLKDSALKEGKEIALIPHFFDPVWEDPEKGWQELKSDVLSFKGDRHMILYVGPTELPEKNFTTLEKAFGKVGEEWCMLICGEVPRSRVRAIDSTGKRLKVLYLSHSHMQVIYPLATVFVLPSLEEPFGISTLEAMSHGLPVLLHNNAHSLWLSNDPEQCVDMRSDEGLVEILNDPIKVQVMKDEKSLLNQRHFLNSFTWECLKEDYLKLFKN